MRKQLVLFFVSIATLFLSGVYLVVDDPNFQKSLASGSIEIPVEKLLTLLISPSPSPVLGTNSEELRVTHVIDGDTIELEDGRTLRYIGIDTPELHHPQKPVECFAREAYQRNRDLVEGQTVRLEKDVSETDRYGRALRYVWLGETLLNEQLVREGYAVARSFPPDVKHQTRLQAAQKQAEGQNAGLWSACSSL